MLYSQFNKVYVIGKVGYVAKLANLGLSLAQLSPSLFSPLVDCMLVQVRKFPSEFSTEIRQQATVLQDLLKSSCMCLSIH